MEAIAKTKYLKGSPRKARLVIDLIRGQKVARALAILKFTEKRAADPIAKTLRSAIANATSIAEKQNIAVDPDDLWIKTCFVDMGPTKGRKRMRPAPQGRAYREQRHYCHITIQVTSDEKPKTEKDLLIEAAKARSAERPKKLKGPAAKAAAPKVEKKAKAENVEEVEIPVVETPAADVAEQEVANNADVADVKNAETAAEATSNDTKPADEAQETINEDVEKQ
jgi:large subunit ribosomal protein L22